MRPRPRLLVLSTVLVIGSPLAWAGVAHASPAAPPASALPQPAESSTLQCASSVPIFRVTTTGDLYRYQHLEPETGVQSWATNPPKIGDGWQHGRSLAAPNGVIYAPWEDGTLRRYRWNGTTWDTFTGGAQYETIDPTGWDRHLTPAYRNRITVDTEGHLYTVEPDGNLHWRAYDATTQTWTHRVVENGWSQFNLIVAGGRGVLYARMPNGNLYRYRYHAVSQRWLQYGQTAGVGWQMFDRMLAAGGDIVYGIRGDNVGFNGDMLWYRFDENTNTWDPTSGNRMGGGWHDWTTTATPDSCQRIGTTTPARPTVTTQAHAPVTLLNTTNGHVHYTYVDSENRAIHAEAADLTGGTPIGLAAIPGFTTVTGPTSTGEHHNGRVQLVATGHDAELRTNTQTTTSGPWATTDTLGGFIPTTATTVRLADTTLNIYALDTTGILWTRKQTGPDGPHTAWLPLAATPLAPTSPLTIVPADTGVRIIGRGTNGHFHTATHSGFTTSTWTDLGGPTFTGTASAVAMPDNTIQLFATDTTGTIHTQRQTSTGFPATWTAIPGITATGRPSAIMAPDGTLQIVARATDNYVYYTGQPAPGADAFNPWNEITGYTEHTSTDPTALAVPTSNTWIIAYRNNIDAPKLRRYQPPTTKTTPTFTNIPLILTDP